MKEGLGDILYFLAMIAFFVISAIAKSKKAKKKVVPPSKPFDHPAMPKKGAGNSGFPWLDEIFKEESEDVVTETVQEPEPEPELVAEEVVIEVETDRKVKNNIKKQKQPFDHYDVKDSDQEGSYWDEEEFDLRKAVIFSEILKRPEF